MKQLKEQGDSKTKLDSSNQPPNTELQHLLQKDFQVIMNDHAHYQ